MAIPNTTKGYSYYHVVSALQKCVRRGKEREATYFAFELIESGHYGTLMRRLKTIIWEDVGIGDMQASLFANEALKAMDEFYQSNNGGWRLCLTSAIMALCRAENKSRDSDYLQAAILFQRRTGELIPIPDEALDKHTYEGKKQGRGVDHFVDVGGILKPNNVSNQDYKEMARAAWHWEKEKENNLFPEGNDKPKKSPTNGNTLADYS